jgi:hypothetical protein
MSVDYRLVEQQFKSCYDLIRSSGLPDRELVVFYSKLCRAYACKKFYERSDYLDILFDELCDLKMK